MDTSKLIIDIVSVFFIYFTIISIAIFSICTRESLKKIKIKIYKILRDNPNYFYPKVIWFNLKIKWYEWRLKEK